jgi:hypothetical protein
MEKRTNTNNLPTNFGLLLTTLISDPTRSSSALLAQATGHLIANPQLNVPRSTRSTWEISSAYSTSFSRLPSTIQDAREEEETAYLGFDPTSSIFRRQKGSFPRTTYFALARLSLLKTLLCCSQTLYLELKIYLLIFC